MAKSSTAPSAKITTAFSAGPIGIIMFHARTIRKEGTQKRRRWPFRSLCVVQTLRFARTAADGSRESVGANICPAFVGVISAMTVEAFILRDLVEDERGILIS